MCIDITTLIFRLEKTMDCQMQKNKELFFLTHNQMKILAHEIQIHQPRNTYFKIAFTQISERDKITLIK